MKQLRLNNTKYNSKGKGFTPKNPAKNVFVSKKNPEEDVSKYDFDAMLQGSRRDCAELEAAIEVYEIMRAIPEQIHEGADLLKLLEERDSYLDKVRFAEESEVKVISLTQRPKGKNLLAEISDGLKKEIASVKTLQQAEALQKKYLDRHGLEFRTMDYQKPPSYDERRVKRAEFNGGINKPLKRNLSAGYADFKENGGGETLGPADYRMEDYPAWQMLSAYPNFERKKDEFAAALSYAKVPPQLAAQMNVFDFEDVMFSYHEDCRGDAGLNYVHLFEGSREFTLKTFIKNHGEEFREILKKMRVEPENAERAAALMQKGRLPVIPLPDGKVLRGTVHHLHAIYDSAALEISQNGPKDVNDADNHVIIFEVYHPRPQNEQPAKLSKSWDELAEDNELTVASEGVDWLRLANDADAKKEYIKKLTKENGPALLSAMQALGFDNQEIVRVVRPMLEKGELEAAVLPNGSLAGLNLIRNGNRAVLRFGMIEQGMSLADIHHGIFHGNSQRPVYEEDGGQKIVPAENERAGEGFVHEKDAYAIEGGERRKVIKRIMAKSRKVTQDNGEIFETHPMCYVGSLDHVIMFSPADRQDAVHRYDRQYRQQNRPDRRANYETRGRI